MTFDLHQGHHHFQLASGLLLTKYGSHSTKFTPFNLWWPLTSIKVIIILSLHQGFFWPNVVAVAQFIPFDLWWPLTSSKVIIILSLRQGFFWPNMVAIAHSLPHLTSDDLWPPIKVTMRTFGPSSTHIPNIIQVGHMVPEKCAGQIFA